MPDNGSFGSWRLEVVQLQGIISQTTLWKPIMARTRHLNHAPILEAVIDLRVEPRTETTYEALKHGLKPESFGYYEVGPIHLGNFGIAVAPNAVVQQFNTPVTTIGIRYHSADEKYVFQGMTHSFTISRLEPYEDWEHLKTEAQRIWEIYLETTKPQSVERIATRFINNLRLPMRVGDSFEDYLFKFGDVPDGVPQSISSFTHSLSVHEREKQASVNLTVSLQPSQEIRPELPVIMDIDVFAFRKFSPRDTNIWTCLDDLRKIKNDCFFGSITEKAAELYE